MIGVARQVQQTGRRGPVIAIPAVSRLHARAGQTNQTVVLDIIHRFKQELRDQHGHQARQRAPDARRRKADRHDQQAHQHPAHHPVHQHGAASVLKRQPLRFHLPGFNILRQRRTDKEAIHTLPTTRRRAVRRGRHVRMMRIDV